LHVRLKRREEQREAEEGKAGLDNGGGEVGTEKEEEIKESR
jgi:hypothetical protein